jgi:protocatechuate 3,4-dioxygenase, beta subunit
MKRRALLAGLMSSLAAGAALAQGRRPATPGQFTGPFYPVGDVPLRPDLTTFDGGAALGQIMDLTGRVIDRNGQAIRDARIVFWQSDAQGIYRHDKDDRAAQIDTNFAGYGAVAVREDGTYSLRTILPVPYTGRPPHIHARVWVGRDDALTTQIYLDGQESENGLLFRVLSSFYGDRRRLTIAPMQGGPGLRAEFDFVLDL